MSLRSSYLGQCVILVRGNCTCAQNSIWNLKHNEEMDMHAMKCRLVIEVCVQKIHLIHFVKTKPTNQNNYIYYKTFDSNWTIFV